jgi:hypothetical protein
MAELAATADIAANKTNIGAGTPSWVTITDMASQKIRDYYAAKGTTSSGTSNRNNRLRIPSIPEYHTGGIVEHQGITKNAEVFAKLLAGEVVVTPNQVDKFMNRTLPKLAATNTINNQMSPVISIGDINISGNADNSTIAQLREVRDQIVNDVFKTINKQNHMFNGKPIRAV